jgi:hypothetical protein
MPCKQSDILTWAWLGWIDYWWQWHCGEFEYLCGTYFPQACGGAKTTRRGDGNIRVKILVAVALNSPWGEGQSSLLQELVWLARSVGWLGGWSVCPWSLGLPLPNTWFKNVWELLHDFNVEATFREDYQLHPIREGDYSLMDIFSR